MELWELATREEIRELVARYAHYADGGRFDELVALFADDGELRIDNRVTLRGRDAILAFLEQTRAQLRESPAAGPLRHHVSTLRIDVSGPDTATGVAYFVVLAAGGPDHWGRYRDRYARHEGRWLFVERRVRVDGGAAGARAARHPTPAD